MNQEHIERFQKYCKTKLLNYSEVFPIMSVDGTMGIKADVDESKIIPFGKLKLRFRPKVEAIQVGNLGLNTKFLFKAMKILRRRKYLNLGLYQMDNRRVIFILIEGENNLCIAPRIMTSHYPPRSSISIMELVEPSGGLLMKWICFDGIFGRHEE